MKRSSNGWNRSSPSMVESPGTVHVQRGEDLYLTAAHNIPPKVIAIVAHVPHGKGMAGVAQVKKATGANLQSANGRNRKHQAGRKSS